MERFYNIEISLAYVVLALILLIIAKATKSLLTSYNLNHELTTADNPALGLSLTGYFCGVVIVFLGAAVGPAVFIDPLAETSHDLVPLLKEFGLVFAWALGGIVLLNVGRWIVDKLVLVRFSTVKEIIEDRNAGTGAVEFGNYVATALIVAGAINGTGGGPLTALVFFALGQAALILFTLFYQWLTAYDIHDEIERDNVAAGVALGGSMIAIGVVLLKATSGDFVSWSSNLLDFAFFAVVGFVLLMVLQKVTDYLFIPDSSLSDEIARDRNVSAAWIESIVAIGMAAVIIHMF
jgi:uncharacterized membrane protein YjfL (UPF0719 family)